MQQLSEQDLGNLSFLLNLDSEEAWDDWAESVEDDDLNYALELLQAVAASRKKMHQELDMMLG